MTNNLKAERTLTAEDRVSDVRLAETILSWSYDNPAYFAIAELPNGERIPVDSLKEQSRVETTYKAALQSLSTQQPMGEVETSFQMLMDAYVRGYSWSLENPDSQEFVHKAAYDYADKTTSTLHPNQESGE